MESRGITFLVLALGLLPQLSHGATKLLCPFKYEPTKSCDLHKYWYGKFIDPTDPTDEFPLDDMYNGGTGTILDQAFFYTDTFCEDYPELNIASIDKPGLAQYACARYCTMYNIGANASGVAFAGYWMYSETCGDHGGICSCFHPKICDPNQPNYSDEWMEPDEYGINAALPTNFTAGKLCLTEGQGDPHFTGADGSHFDFSGIPNHAFALISDSHLQLNALMGGRYGPWEGRIKALTWMRKIAIMWGHHTAVFAARSGPDAEYGNGYLDSILVDGELLVVPPYGKADAANGEIVVEWSAAKLKSGRDFVDAYKVSVGDKLVMRLVLRPEVRNLRTKDDGLVHFALSVASAQLSSNAHGVVGQTFRPDFAGRLGKQKLVWSKQLHQMVVPGDNAEGFIDGNVEDYMVKDILRSDCKFCRFARGSMVDEETTSALATSTGTMSFAATQVSRRLLSVH